MHPKWSDWVRIGPSMFKNFEKPRKNSNNGADACACAGAGAGAGASAVCRIHPSRRSVDFSSGVLLALFWLCFSCFFLLSFLRRFFYDFGGVLEANMVPQIEFLKAFRDFFSHPHFRLILYRFVYFFEKPDLEISCAHAAFRGLSQFWT